MEITSADITSTAPARPLRDTALVTIVVVILLLGFALLLSIRNVLASVFLGLLLATALRPVMSKLREGRLPSFAAASAAILLLLGAIVGTVVLVIPLMTAQFGALQAALPAFYSDFRSGLINSDLRLLRQIGGRLGSTLPLPAPSADTLGADSSAALLLVGYLLFVTICTLVFCYYWLLYRDRSLRGLLLLLPMERRAAAENVWLQIEERIGAFLRGQFILGLIVGGLSLVGYWIAGVPYALLLAVIAGILELVPLIGPIIAVGVAMVISLSEGPQTAVAAMIVGIVVQQIENNLLVPRVMDETVGVSPVVTLLAFVGFAALFGPVGALLAIPLAATLQLLFLTWVERRGTPEDVAPEGRSRADRLRYAARAMAADIANHLRTKEEHAHASADAPEERLEQIVLELDSLLTGEGSEPPAAPGTSLAVEVVR